MNPDGTSDKNWFSFYGPQDNGRTLDLLQWDMAIIPAGSTAAIKATTQVEGLTILADVLGGGHENVIDANNGAKNCRFLARIFDVSLTKYGFTNKGGAQDNYFGGLPDENGKPAAAIVRGRGRESEFSQDLWSDQSHQAASSTLNLVPEDGKTPLRVRYLWKKPAFVPGSGPYVFLFPQPWIPLPRSWLARIHNELRRRGFFQ